MKNRRKSYLLIALTILISVICVSLIGTSKTAQGEGNSAINNLESMG